MSREDKNKQWRSQGYDFDLNLTDRFFLGSSEYICFPDMSDARVLAKIDTGAHNGAVHATEIFEDEKNGTLHFRLFGKDSESFCTKKFKKKTVVSAFGHRQERYVIKTRIEICGDVYDMEIGLSDRSNMKFPVILGRRFLKRKNFLVDVNKSAIDY